MSRATAPADGHDAGAGHHEPLAASRAGGGPEARSRLRAVRDAAGAVIGVVLGVVPHLFHHVGLIAGAALITGAGGNALFFVVGLLLSIPMLRRLYRRFHTWLAPAIAVIVFAALFSLSAFVIGPAIAGETSLRPDGPLTPPTSPAVDHGVHHTP